VKVFISVDMEGVTGVTDPEDVAELLLALQVGQKKIYG